MRRTFNSLLAMLIGVAFVGCDGKPTPPALVPHLNSSDITWGTPSDGGVIGIDSGSMSIVSLYETDGKGFSAARDKEVTRIILWGAIDRPETKTTSAKHLSWEHVLPNGTTAQWKCEAIDLKTVKVTIDGKAYDPSKGRLFLLSVSDNELKVLQLDRDTSVLETSKFEQGQDGMKEYAANDDDISQFFRGTE